MRTLNDVIAYPDEDVLPIGKTGKIFRKSVEIEHWSSDPND